MLCYLHYFSSSRRLEEWNKSIKLMGGPEQASNQMLAQRDMVKLEKEYYGERCVIWNFILGVLLFVVVLGIGVINNFKGTL